jgi:hypothetical protein
LQHNIGCFAGQLSASCGVGSQALLSEHSTIGQSLWSADGCLTAEFTNAAAFWNLTAHTHLQNCFPHPVSSGYQAALWHLNQSCMPACQHNTAYTSPATHSGLPELGQLISNQNIRTRARGALVMLWCGGTLHTAACTSAYSQTIQPARGSKSHLQRYNTPQRSALCGRSCQVVLISILPTLHTQ